MRPPSPAVVRARIAEAARSGSEIMAKVVLQNVKKIYPFVSGEEKKKKKKKGEDEAPAEKKANLQITDQGVVAVQEFNLEIADAARHRRKCARRRDSGSSARRQNPAARSRAPLRHFHRPHSPRRR